MLSARYAHSGSVRCLAMSPDMSWVVSGGADRVVRVWSMTGAFLREFIGHGGGVNGVSISPDGRLMLTASGDNIQSLRLMFAAIRSADIIARISLSFAWLVCE